MLDLNAIRARLEAATPGEREVEPGVRCYFVSAHVQPGWEVLAKFGFYREGDAILDAHAPTDIADLLAEVARLRAALEAHDA